MAHVVDVVFDEVVEQSDRFLCLCRPTERLHDRADRQVSVGWRNVRKIGGNISFQVFVRRDHERRHRNVHIEPFSVPSLHQDPLLLDLQRRKGNRAVGTWRIGTGLGWLRLFEAEFSPGSEPGLVSSTSRVRILRGDRTKR